MKGLDQKHYEATIISPRNHFIFTPLLASTTVGTLEFRAVTEPTRQICQNYIQAICTNVDYKNNQIECYDQLHAKPFNLNYDFLVIGVGAVPNTFNIPGVKEHANFLRQVNDARNIRKKIMDIFENASSPHCTGEERSRLLNFVVVGGGPTSVEFSAELHDFLSSDFRRWFPQISVDEVNITLLEASDHILNMFEENLSSFTDQYFKKRKIHIRTKVKVVGVEKDKIILGDGEVIHFGLCVWSTGNTPCDLIKNISLPKHKSGRLLVDDHLKANQNIFAFGDCAANINQDFPQTAQCAQQQGKYLAKFFKEMQKNENLKENFESFKFQRIGIMSYIGGYKSIVELNQVSGKGFLAWIFWRSAYLTRLLSIRNKMLVPMYWFKTFVFGRDITNF